MCIISHVSILQVGRTCTTCTCTYMYRRACTYSAVSLLQKGACSCNRQLLQQELLLLYRGDHGVRRVLWRSMWDDRPAVILYRYRTPESGVCAVACAQPTPSVKSCTVDVHACNIHVLYACMQYEGFVKRINRRENSGAKAAETDHTILSFLCSTIAPAVPVAL